MKEKRNIILGLMIVASLLMTLGCDPLTGPTVVTFESAEQTGGTSGTTDSTALTLTFSVDPTTLAPSDITVTGATKGVLILSGSGTTKTVAISNITVGNGETVSVSIASPGGFTLTGSPQTAVVYKAVIGTPYQGGVIAYVLQPGDPGYVSGQTHGLIASTADLISTGIQWYPGTNTEIGATDTALGTGRANTTKIVNYPAAVSGYAARLCHEYTNADTGTGVYSDWYLPSKDEMWKIWWNLVSDQSGVNEGKGEPRSDAVGGFVSTFYWSSSEHDALNAWLQSFYNGYQYAWDKSNGFRVRAARAF